MTRQTHTLATSVKEFTAYIILYNINEDSKKPIQKFRVVTAKTCTKQTQNQKQNTGRGGEKVYLGHCKRFQFLAAWQKSQHHNKEALANSKTMLLFSASTYSQL